MNKVFIGIFAVFALAACKPDDSPEGLAKSAPFDARIACASLIESRLRNPSSAEWVGMAQWPVVSDADGKTHNVAATYRATNGFGGVVTEQKVCVARRLHNNRMVAIHLL